MARLDMVHGLPHLEHVDQLYDMCVIAKQRWTSFPMRAMYRASELIDVVHADLCGPITPPTPDGC